MDDELLELQRQFEFAQQAKSSIRLSERNVVELVQKLQELHIIDFDLLHTVSGKEYITPEQLRNEMVAEVNKLGRVSLIDLADATGVDLYHVEKQAQQVITDHPEMLLIQGEIMSESYWDSVAEETNERLQECSQIALTELAAQLNVGLELVASMLEPRLGTVVKRRLEGGQLYAPAYVPRVSAMVRGAARGITVPTNLSALWSLLQQLLQEMDGISGVAVDGSFFHSLFNGLVKECGVLGSLRAGIHWPPAVFAIAQKESVDSFFSQMDSLKIQLEKFYGKNPLESKDLSRIVNSNHFSRLTKLLEDDKVAGKIVYGGEKDESKLRISPTILLDVPQNSLIMKEEIFGPLLPIITSL